MQKFGFRIGDAEYEVEAEDAATAEKMLLESLGQTTPSQPPPAGPDVALPPGAYATREEAQQSAAGGAQIGRSVAAGLARVPVGMGQLVTGIGDLVGWPGASLSEYKTAADSFLTSIRGNEYGDDTPPEQWIPERAAELGLGVAFGVPSRTFRFWDTIKAAALNAGIGAGIQYDESRTVAEKTGSIALGTLAGVGLGGLINGAGMAKHEGLRWLVNRFRANPDQAQMQAVEELEMAFPELADYLTLGQRSGAREMAEAEAKAAGKFAQDAYRQQAAILQAKLAQYGEKYGAGWNADDAAKIAARRGEAATRAEMKALADIRKAEWDAMIGSAEAAMTASKISQGGIEGSEQIMFDATGLEDGLLTLVNDFNVSKADLAPAFQKMRDQIEIFKGQLPLETVLEMLKKANSENFRVLGPGVSDDAQRAFAKGFRSLLFNAVDQAPEEAGDAVKWIKRARQSYAQRSAQMDEFRNSRVAQLLGIDGPVADPEAALDALTKLGKDQQTRARDLLAKWDPQLLSELRANVWKNAMDRATSNASDATIATFDPVVFTEQMIKNGELRASGLFSEADQVWLSEALPPIRAILYSRGFQSRALEIENAAMTAAGAARNVTNSAPFVARNLFRLFSGPIMDEKFFTPEGRRILLEAANAVDTPKFNAALGRLLALSDDPIWTNVVGAE